MPGVKTNEVPGTRAVLRHFRMSATKARQVLDLVRGQEVDRAEEILRATPREGARVVGKVLASAVANARNNDLLDPDDLYVSACYADEGTTIKRWRPRARGRATRIRKRTCHITVIVSRLPDDRLEVRRARLANQSVAGRSRRVAASRRTAPGAGDRARIEESTTDDQFEDVEDVEVEVEDVGTTEEEDVETTDGDEDVETTDGDEDVETSDEDEDVVADVDADVDDSAEGRSGADGVAAQDEGAEADTAQAEEKD